MLVCIVSYRLSSRGPFALQVLATVSFVAFYVCICVLSLVCCCLLFSRMSLALQALAPAIRFELLWPVLLPGVQPRAFGLQVLASVFALLDCQSRAFGLAGAGSSCYMLLLPPSNTWLCCFM